MKIKLNLNLMETKTSEYVIIIYHNSDFSTIVSYK